MPAPALPWRDILATTVLAAAGVAVGVAWPGSLAVAALAVVGFGFVAAALAAYAFTGALIPIVAPIVALAVAGGGARAWRGRADRRDRRLCGRCSRGLSASQWWTRS